MLLKRSRRRGFIKPTFRFLRKNPIWENWYENEQPLFTEQEMSLSDVIQTALDKVNFIARTETVIGEPIVAGEVTLIPVSKISIGFAAGGAGNESKSGSGAGTGGGVNIIPVAFISISKDKVQVHPISKAEIELSDILSYAPEAIKKVAKFMKNREPKEKPSTGTGKQQKEETGSSEDKS
ncbi:MAG: hypothetical protein GF350_04830 [Chitinivibrionales bacterium]|nr:hypothetical protein [Chitinivibrionales bacterium]